MKRILLLCAGVLAYAATFAQTSYTLDYTPGAGNPGAINTDLDDATLGWTPLIGASITTNQWSPVNAIPFVFNFFGNPVTDFKVSANGLITFSNTTTLPDDNVAIPSSNLTDSTIACFWDAFTSAAPTASNDLVVWKVWGTAPNRQLWIKWASYEIGAPSVSNTSFMCMLEEGTDKIYLVEGNLSVAITTPTSSTTAGIQLNNTTGLMYGTATRTRVANTNAPGDNNVITFTPYVKTNMTFVDFTTSQPITSNVSKNALNEAIMRLEINMDGELSPVNLTQIDLNTAGTSINSDITNARVFYSGSDSNLSTATQFGTTAVLPNGAFTVTGAQALKQGKNYLWVTYSISNTATTDNVVDITCLSATIGGTVQLPLETSPVGSRTIKAGLSGTINVGTGNTYEYLSDVFKVINENGLSNNTILSITSDINDTAVALLTYSGNYSIRIVPSDEVFRNFNVTMPTTYIELSGAKNVTFDGKGLVSGSGKYLRFINKDINGSTISMINGARFNTIQNCIIEGTINSQNQGVINLGTSFGCATGVRDIHIINNDIRDRSDSIAIPAIMIFSGGTTDLTNGNITISNNNIFNFRRSAVYVNTGNINDGNFAIIGNHIYYNASSTPANGDIVPIMFIPGPYSENNVISGNYIGGQSPFCGGSAWVAPNVVNFVAMNINVGMATGTSIQGNTIQNITLTASGALDFAGIRMESGKIDVGTVTGNTIGHPTNPNSIINPMRLTLCIYGFYSAGEYTIANNTIANITGTGTASTGGVRGICIQAGGPKTSIYNNTIYNLSTSIGQTGPLTSALMGIGINSGEASSVLIRNNTIHGLSATSAAAAVVPSGIIVDNSTNDGIVEYNKIYDITNTSSSATALIHGIYIAGGTKNWIIRNNMVSVTNGSNTGAMTLRGISDNASGNVNSYYNNTVYVGGTATSGALNSFAFERRTSSTLNIRNNIFYNERTGGTGVHAAIANVAGTPVTNWDANTSGYNLLVAQNPATIGAWGNTFTPQTFNQWQTSSSGDKTSWSDVSATVLSTSFFKNVGNGDLSIDSSNALCWYANGKGIALAESTQDINGQSRSTAIATGAQDIGADEFPTTTLPPNATVTGNISGGDTSIFTFAGRTLARVYWNSGIFPTAINLRYYSGNNPPAAGSQKYFNSYYHFLPTGTGSFDANVELFYDTALFGTVTSSASLLMADYTSTWNNNASTIVDQAISSFRTDNVTALNIFTGTDGSNPLPVKLIQFNGVAQHTNALLFWQSAVEINASTYTIERSLNGKQFEETGVVNANNKASKYQFTDDGIFEKQSRVYYRLKMTDLDGKTEYSSIISIQHNKSEKLTASVYPNPYTNESSLSFVSDRVQQVTVTISDISGRIVGTRSFTTEAGLNIIPVALQNERSGVYFIQLTTASSSFQTKIVK